MKIIYKVCIHVLIILSHEEVTIQHKDEMCLVLVLLKRGIVRLVVI